jgi:cell division transport system ATP-binding protein
MEEKGFVTQYAMPLIELNGVDISNDDGVVLHDVNLTLGRGDFMYLVGKVGSGKSTIIKTLIAELPVLTGKARVGDYDLTAIRKKQIPFLRRNIGVVFQDFQLLMDKTIEENLLFVLEATGWTSRSEMLTRAADVMELVGMQDKMKKMPFQLSGGEQQRAAIARALLNNPSIILADEPTGNLDTETATEIMDLLMKIHKVNQPAVLMVTHNKHLFQRYPGKIMVCEEGKCRPFEDNTISEVDFDSLFKE